MTRRNWIAGLLGLFAGRAVAEPQREGPAGDAGPSVRQRLRAAFPYPVVSVAGHEALARWQALRDAGKGWPVIVGDDAALDDILEQFTLDMPSLFQPGAKDPPLPSVAEIVAESRTIAWPEGLRDWAGAEPDAAPPSAAWPAADAVTPNGPTTALDLHGRPFATVHIVVLPTTRSWEVPAYLRWGNWNACPPPALHCAALRQWEAAFGAELVGINRDTLNLRVARRPADRAPALALAKTHYAYCPDIADQGVASIEALAQVLLQSDWWFFWWD